MPAITVLMPVRNGAAYVRQALDSVIAQTFGDIEILVIDDGSDDATPAILAAERDPRLRVVRNPAPLGVASSLNRGLELAAGKFIARMDADDECLPDRLGLQLAHLRANPAVAVCGGRVRLCGRYSGALLRRPSGAACVKASLCLDNPLIHPTVMLRKSLLHDRGFRYDPAFSRSEDYDLWCRIASVAGIDNLTDVLLRYRLHAASVSAVAADVMEQQTRAILARELRLIGVEPSPEELLLHRRAGHGARLASEEELARAGRWFSRLADANRSAGTHPPDGMAAALGFAWFALCANCGNLGTAAWRQWRSSPLRAGYAPSPAEWLRFALGIIRHGVSGATAPGGAPA